MNRRDLLKHLVFASGVLIVRTPASLAESSDGSSEPFPPVNISREEWKQTLPADRFHILFEDGTEPAGSSPLDEVDEAGTYICAACFLPLFDSEDKFDSGTGWPSFTRPVEGHVETQLDFTLVLPRTEYHCARCGGHQGHVFDDGPPPTGERWCNNGLALRFVPEDEPLPALRRSI